MMKKSIGAKIEEISHSAMDMNPHVPTEATKFTLLILFPTYINANDPRGVIRIFSYGTYARSYRHLHG